MSRIGMAQASMPRNRTTCQGDRGARAAAASGRSRRARAPTRAAWRSPNPRSSARGRCRSPPPSSPEQPARDPRGEGVGGAGRAALEQHHGVGLVARASRPRSETRSRPSRRGLRRGLERATGRAGRRRGASRAAPGSSGIPTSAATASRAPSTSTDVAAVRERPGHRLLEQVHALVRLRPVGQEPVGQVDELVERRVVDRDMTRLLQARADGGQHGSRRPRRPSARRARS